MFAAFSTAFFMIKVAVAGYILLFGGALLFAGVCYSFLALLSLAKHVRGALLS